MKNKIEEIKEKYKAQDELLDTFELEDLDERTLHDILKAMLIYTSKDCIEFENWMDPSMAEITNILNKEDKTKDDLIRMKSEQESLKETLDSAQYAENGLYNLIYNLLLNDRYKFILRNEIPALFESVYCLIDMEEEIAENITATISELVDILTFDEICNLINYGIEDCVNNAEEILDEEEMKDNELYGDFLKAREEYNNSKQGKKEDLNE